MKLYGTVAATLFGLWLLLAGCSPSGDGVNSTQSASTRNEAPATGKPGTESSRPKTKNTKPSAVDAGNPRPSPSATSKNNASSPEKDTPSAPPPKGRPAGTHTEESSKKVNTSSSPAKAKRPEPMPKQPAELYTYRRDHAPGGIGKFYMGREISRVMGYRGARWLERPSRENEEKTSLLPELLDVQPGMTVADIGAGTGVVSVLMAQAVGPQGEVLAVDVQEEMLALLRKKLKRRNINNVRTIKGTQKSPHLEANTVDLVVMVDVYHEFAFPYEMMREISEALKPGGRAALVEYRKEDPSIPIKPLHKMSEAQVKKEMSHPEFGLQWQETIEKLPRQHVIVFEKTQADGSPVGANAGGIGLEEDAR